MVSKRLSRAYAAPVPAGEVRNWAGSPPNDAGVLPLAGQAFNPAHFPELLAQHGDAVLPNKPSVDGVYSVVGHGQQGDVTLASNDTDVDFNEIVHDFGQQIYGFHAAGEEIIVYGSHGFVWASKDGGNNFTQLPLYLNSGSPGSHSSNQYVRSINHGDGTWFVGFGNYCAVCRGDILTPAEWVALPISLGGLTNGVSGDKNNVATDGNGTWMVAGEWHQFAWTHDNFQTINVSEQPSSSNYSTVKVPFSQYQGYTHRSFVWYADGGWFAGSREADIRRCTDNLSTWDLVTYKFNTGASAANPLSMIDCGNGHFICCYGGIYFSESFDYGVTWIRRAQYLGSSTTVYNIATNQADIVLLQKFSSPNHQIITSKNDAQTFSSAANQDANYNIPIKFWRDAWYAASGDSQKLVRSLNGFVRTEWELA